MSLTIHNTGRSLFELSVVPLGPISNILPKLEFIVSFAKSGVKVALAKVGESVVFKPKSHLIVDGEFKSNEPNVKISISSPFVGAVAKVTTVLLVFVKSVL